MASQEEATPPPAEDVETFLTPAEDDAPLEDAPEDAAPDGKAAPSGEGFEVMGTETFEKAARARASTFRPEEEPILSNLEDHFTLAHPSNLVRFRNKRNAARVYESEGIQMILEEHYDEEEKTSKINVRSMSDKTAGVTFLRILYSTVCALWTGFFFVFCLQVFLFLVLDLAVQSGATSIDDSVHAGQVIGVALAIVMFVRAFSEALVIAGHFIMDTWSGHSLTKQFVFKFSGDVAIEWIFFSCFLGIPLVVMSISLLARVEQWWSITAITWFGLVMGFFGVFTCNVIFYEVKAAYDFCANMRDDDSDAFWDVIQRCITLRQCHNYSGKQMSMYLTRSLFDDSEDAERLHNKEKAEKTEGSRPMNVWAEITKRFPSSLYTQLETPTRLHTMEDVQDYRPLLTRNTWSLEKIFCRPKDSRYLAIVQGPGHLTMQQLRSSLICSLLGTALIILVLVSFLVWFRIPGGFVAFVFFICLFFAWGALSNARKLSKIGKDLIDIQQEMDSEDKAPAEIEAQDDLSPSQRRFWKKAGTSPSEAVYMVSEYRRVNVITDKFARIMFVLEIGCLYLWPLITLLMISWNMGVLFFICVTVSGVRHYINAQVVIEETGNMDLVGGETPEIQWENKSRLNEIVTSITLARSRKLWVSILGAGGFAFLAIFLTAVGSSTEATNSDEYQYLPNFYYPPLANDMHYPTCTLTNLPGGFGTNSTMADFTFMASSAYFAKNETQPALDSWFQDVEAIDRQDIVDEFREREDPDNSAVFFKLYTFPQYKLAMIVIRGTSNNWDMLADSQLWSAAALMQGWRVVLPAGEIWSPILDQLVNWMNTLASKSLQKVSFYTLTRKFAEELKKNPEFDSVQVTGHSLGGGLSMITGAQAEIPAIGLSGPNALISGRSFNPPVTKEQLNKYTFNIIPNKDIVAMLDDPADQIQRIRCKAGAYDFVGCHFAKRSMCEIIYTCGTGPGRPALCNCYTEFGYPKPITDGDEDFDAVCGLN